MEKIEPFPIFKAPPVQATPESQDLLSGEAEAVSKEPSSDNKRKALQKEAHKQSVAATLTTAKKVDGKLSELSSLLRSLQTQFMDLADQKLRAAEGDHSSKALPFLRCSNCKTEPAQNGGGFCSSCTPKSSPFTDLNQTGQMPFYVSLFSI